MLFVFARFIAFLLHIIKVWKNLMRKASIFGWKLSILFNLTAVLFHIKAVRNNVHQIQFSCIPKWHQKLFYILSFSEDWLFIFCSFIVHFFTFEARNVSYISTPWYWNFSCVILCFCKVWLFIFTFYIHLQYMLFIRNIL